MIGSERRFLILADGALGVFSAKTAVGLIRYRPSEVVGILDQVHAGRRLGDLLGIDHPAPIVATLEAGLALRPDTLVIGIAPRGGILPPLWRDLVRGAIDAGLDIVSGLHLLLADDAELAERAARRGVAIHDLRRPPARLRLPREAGAPPPHPRPFVLLTVGSDCNVGKMTAALEVTRAARRAGIDAAFAATGQTGILIAAAGIAVDRIIADFVAGAAEELVDRLGPVAWAVVEGQGSLIHPAYSGVTLGLLHGARPDAMILCHHVGRTAIEGYGVPIPSLEGLVNLYEEAAAWVQPAPVVGVAMNPHGAAPGAVAALAAAFETSTGRLAVDPTVAPERLVEAVRSEWNSWLERRLERAARGRPQ